VPKQRTRAEFRSSCNIPLWSYTAIVTLSDLTRSLGQAVVAAAMARTERQLIDLRRGWTPLTVDDLFLLYRAFPQFDLLGTVREVGERREATGRARHVKASS